MKTFYLDTAQNQGNDVSRLMIVNATSPLVLHMYILIFFSKIFIIYFLLYWFIVFLSTGVAANSPFPNYAPLLTNKTFKSRLGAHFSYICCIFEHLASTRCFCLSAVERNSEMEH